MGDTGTTTPGWYSDPTERFEVRYHNGRSWTADVSTDGERYVDPLGTSPPAHQPSQPTDQLAHQPASPGSNSVAITSMVLGIISICIGWMPFVVALGIIAAITAIGLGISGRSRAAAGSGGGGFAVAGIVCGAVGLLVAIGGIAFSVSLLRAVERFNEPAAHEATITSCKADGVNLTATGTLTNTSSETATFTVRVSFVRPGTDNAQRELAVPVLDVAPGDSRDFEATRQVGDLDLDCIIGAVRGPLPYGVDPGT